MPTLNIFELRQRFWKSVEYVWRYRVFAGTVYRLKVGNFKCGTSTKFSPCHCKSKIPARLKLSTQMPTLQIFALWQRFRKSDEYLWRYRIIAGRVYRLKVGNFKCCTCAKFSPCHCKKKIAALLKLSCQMPTLNSFERRQRFRKSVEYLWRYRIIAGRVYRLKVGNFKCSTCAKFSPCHCKSKIPARLKLSTQMPTLQIFALWQRFRKSDEYLWRYRIIAGRVYRLNVGNFKCCTCTKFFSLPLQK